MKVEKEEVIVTPYDIEITGAILLSVAEYEEYMDNIPLLDNWWWLRSPGKYNSCRAAVVDNSGRADYIGDLVDTETNAIRPALKIADLGALKVGDKIKCGGYPFTIISPHYALCDTAIVYDLFRYNMLAEDSNVYKRSNAKKIVDKFFKDIIENSEK